MNSNTPAKVVRPRGIPWLIWCGIAFVLFAVISVGLYFWAQAYKTITVAADTTYLTAPLSDDGYPDYLRYLNTQNSQGVTPENNAWVAILRCMGPKELEEGNRAEHFKLLGIAPLPEQGNYFRAFYDPERVKQLPDKVLIAASVAAQMPYHVRFARLAALNAEKRATAAASASLEGSIPPEENFELNEWITGVIGGVATGINDYATDPVAAAQAAFAAAEIADDELIGDSEQIQDLREPALKLIKPIFNEPEEEAAWRREIFNNAAIQLLDREDQIVEERPWTREECPIAAHWLDQYSPQLDQLARDMAVRTEFFVPHSGDKTDALVKLPALQSLRALSMALNIRVLHRLKQQDIAGAIRDFELQVRLSQCCPQSPFLVDLLVGYALHGIALNTMKEIALHPATTADDLQALAAILERPLKFPTWAHCLDQGERLFAINCVVSLIARRQESELFKDNEYWEESIVCWDEVLQEMNYWYDQFSAAAKTNSYAAVQQVQKQLAAYPNGALYKEQFEKKPWYLLPSQKTAVMKYFYAQMFLPSLAAAMQANQKFQIRNDLARLYIALERFHRAQGKYPAALAELVPAYLPAVPNDLIDGSPLRYQRNPAGGYRAYSIWINGVDDGGTSVVDPDGGVRSYQDNDLVIGSPDELTRKQLFSW